MSIRIVVDMNLSPDWATVLTRAGWPTVHWATIGDPRATDREIMDWALANDHVVFTHDLDFGTMLALTHATGPSVLQVRGQDVLPDHLEVVVVAAIRQHEADLAAGALVVVDEARRRVRILPIV
jgi:predicted nuclease of predicted toxin-antitoxin system